MSDALTDRLHRIDMYGRWLADDIDGLVTNLSMPPAMPVQGSSVILTAARDRLKIALAQVEQAVSEAKSQETR